MRLALALGTLMLASACVPTTKYKYVPLSRENFEAAQNGDRIPLVAHNTALCFADARTAFVRDAEWTDTGICGRTHAPVGDDDGQDCIGWEDLAGIGIPYEGRSLSAVPMAAVQIGQCDPLALAAQAAEDTQ